MGPADVVVAAPGRGITNASVIAATNLETLSSTTTIPVDLCVGHGVLTLRSLDDDRC